MAVIEWIEKIVNTHHAYLKKELPELALLIEASKAGETEESEWRRLRRAFSDLKRELEMHLLKEEVMLFPSILHIESAVARGEKPDLARHDIRESLEQAEYEHDATEQFLSEMAKAMSKIGKKSQTADLFEKLEQLKRDLEEHIHKEEKGLFPEARFLYAKATEGMIREE